jgi:hypothetical protein
MVAPFSMVLGKDVLALYLGHRLSEQQVWPKLRVLWGHAFMVV